MGSGGGFDISGFLEKIFLVSCEDCHYHCGLSAQASSVSVPTRPIQVSAGHISAFSSLLSMPIEEYGNYHW